MCKGAPPRLLADFSKETFQARKEQQETFQVMKGKDPQSRLLYPARLSFRAKGEMVRFSHKKRLKESITTKLVLQEMLKGFSKKIKNMNKCRKEKNYP